MERSRWLSDAKRKVDGTCLVVVRDPLPASSWQNDVLTSSPSMPTLVFTASERYNKGTFINTFKSMFTITLQDIKTKGAKAIPDDKTSYLIVNSRPKAVLVPPAEYEAMMEALEELEDIRAIDERKDGDTVPFEVVFPKPKR